MCQLECPRKSLLGLVVGIFVAALALQNQQRYAILEKCIAQAQKEYPDAGQETTMRQRTMSYEACMAKTGQAP